MNLFPRALTILVSVCIFHASIVTSDLLRTTTSITYKDGVLLATNFPPIEVSDPLSVGRNNVSTFEYRCNSTMDLPDANKTIVADIFFVGNGCTFDMRSPNLALSYSVTSSKNFLRFLFRFASQYSFWQPCPTLRWKHHHKRCYSIEHYGQLIRFGEPTWRLHKYLCQQQPGCFAPDL